MFLLKKKLKKVKGREKCYAIGCYLGGVYIVLIVMEYNGSFFLGGFGVNVYSFLFVVLLEEVFVGFISKMYCYYYLLRC